jgi:gamma-glutamyltranspeptidase
MTANVASATKLLPYRGTVAGFALAHRTYGVLPWRTVLEPARRLASKGFPASQRLELILRLQVPVMKDYGPTARVFLHGSDQPLKQGELVRQPDLASTISRLQRNPRDFYTGETAKRIAAAMAAHGGSITLADLEGVSSESAAAHSRHVQERRNPHRTSLEQRGNHPDANAQYPRDLPHEAGRRRVGALSPPGG